MRDEKIVKSHGEEFNIDILKFRDLKNSSYKDTDQKTNADSKAFESDEDLEFVSSEDALSLYEDENLESDKVDQNSRKFQRSKSQNRSPSKNGNKEISLILEKDVFEFASKFGSGARKNASAGSGIKKMIQKFFSMNTREEHQLRRIELILRLQEDATYKLASLKMKSGSAEDVSAQEIEVLKFSKDVVYFSDLFGFSIKELYDLIPVHLHASLSDSYTRVTNYTREKRILELHGNI